MLFSIYKGKNQSSPIQEDKAEAFLKRLEDFLSHEEKSFAEYAAHISKEAEELTRIKNELQHEVEVHAGLNKRYENLLNQQDLQIERLSRLPNLKPVKIEIQDKTVANNLSKFGIYAIDMPKERRNKMMHKIILL